MAKELMEMNSAELKQVRTSLPADHDPKEVAALNDRIMEVSIEEGIQSGMGRLETRQTARELDTQAAKRWPELKDKESDFYKAVNAELESRGDSETNPRALNDAANKVGLDRGMVNNGWAASADTAKIMGIKAPGEHDGNDGDGQSFTKANADILEQMSEFIDTKDEKVLERIDAAVEEK